MYQWDHASLRQSNRADILAIMLTAERCISVTVALAAQNYIRILRHFMTCNKPVFFIFLYMRQN